MTASYTARDVEADCEQVDSAVAMVRKIIPIGLNLIQTHELADNTCPSVPLSATASGIMKEAEEDELL